VPGFPREKMSCHLALQSFLRNFNRREPSEDRPFLIPVAGLIGSPCRPSGALVTPGQQKGMGGNEKGDPKTALS